MVINWLSILGAVNERNWAVFNVHAIVFFLTSGVTLHSLSKSHELLIFNIVIWIAISSVHDCCRCNICLSPVALFRDWQQLHGKPTLFVNIADYQFVIEHSHSYRLTSKVTVQLLNLCNFSLNVWHDGEHNYRQCHVCCWAQSMNV